jgi:transcriptional regulator with XRE-family HTH domain
MLSMGEAMRQSRSAAPPSPSAVGALLQYWRKARSLSQLALAAEAEVSPRHLCFVETGRATPSRDMVLLLTEALRVPLRERNALLLAAGYAPIFVESSLDDPALAAVRAAVHAILRQQEPYPAVVMNRRWDIVGANEAAVWFFGRATQGRAAVGGTPNVLRQMFHPDGLRPAVKNWDVVGPALIQRIHREASGGVVDSATRALIEELLGYPDVPKSWQALDPRVTLTPVLPITFIVDGITFNYFSAVTVLGTALDITLQELRIESFFPCDDATIDAARTFESERQRAASSVVSSHTLT